MRADGVCRGAWVPRLMAGVVVTALGVLFLLDNLGLYEAGRMLRWWPVAVMLFGLAQLAGNQPGSRAWGGVLIVGGAWLLAQRAGWISIDLSEVLWPALVLLLGLTLVVRSLRPRLESAGASSRPAGDLGSAVVPAGGEDDVLSAFAILSGVHRVNRSRSFRGGDATAVMGGCEIDLRQASIVGPEATLDCFAFWGGIEIKVPADWQVVGKVVPVMGGFEDKTHPTASTGPRLVVRGWAIMGGVDIAN